MADRGTNRHTGSGGSHLREHTRLLALGGSTGLLDGGGRRGGGARGDRGGGGGAGLGGTCGGAHGGAGSSSLAGHCECVVVVGGWLKSGVVFVGGGAKVWRWR